MGHPPLSKFSQRVTTSVVAVAAGWAAQVLLHKTIIGIPVAIWARWKLGQWFKKSESRKILDHKINFVCDARQKLAQRLELPTSAWAN